MRVIQLSDAVNQLDQVMDQVVSDRDVTIISCAACEAVVLMSKAEYNGMIDILHLLSSSANVKHLNRSLAQYYKS
jgi:antitoxin YefM